MKEDDKAYLVTHRSAAEKKAAKEKFRAAEKRAMVKEKQVKPKHSFWGTLLHYMKPFKPNIFGAMIFCMITGFSVTMQSLVISYVVDSGLGNKTFSVLGLELFRAEGAADSARLTFIGILAASYVTFAVLRMFCWWWGRYNILKLEEGVLFTIRSKFFDHVQRMCMRFHDKNASGELYNYIMGTPMAHVRAQLENMAQNVPYQVVQLVLSLGVLISFNPLLTALIFCTATLMAVLNRRSWGRVRRRSRLYLDAEREASKYVTDAFHGSEAIKMYSIEQSTVASFEQHMLDLRETGIRYNLTNSIELMKTEFVQYVGTALVYFVGAFLCLRGEVQVGELYLFISTMGTILGILSSWLSIALSQNTAAVALDRVQSIIDENSTTPEVRADARRSLAIEKESAIRHGKPCICFDHVSFAYGDNKEIFRDLSCAVNYNESIGLVGGSGSGKSTFTKLVMRLYEVNGGEIRVHDRNVKDYETHELRLSFGVVPQNPYIFRGSIWDNIKIVRPEATNYEIIQAMELARVHEFVNDLPMGWSTMIGDGALSLSGGQKQRIAIARAVLKKPDIFIFDEATSALDNVSERLIQEAMEELMKSHTIIFVAHRLSTIRNVNRILVFRHGEIIEEGTYDELAAGDGEFRRLLDAAEGALETGVRSHFAI